MTTLTARNASRLVTLLLALFLGQLAAPATVQAMPEMSLAGVQMGTVTNDEVPVADEDGGGWGRWLGSFGWGVAKGFGLAVPRLVGGLVRGAANLVTDPVGTLSNWGTALANLPGAVVNGISAVAQDPGLLIRGPLELARNDPSRFGEILGESLFWTVAPTAAVGALSRVGALNRARQYTGTVLGRRIARARTPQSLSRRAQAVRTRLASNPRVQGTRFEGPLHRLMNPKRNAAEAWLERSHNVSANGRYTPPGTGGVYGGTSSRTAARELAHYDPNFQTRVPISRNATVDNVLDLTDPRVRRELGVNLSDLTHPADAGYEIPQLIGQWARNNGYGGLKVPSVRNPGGNNVVVFGGLE